MSQEKAAEIIDLSASREAAGAGQPETAGQFLANARQAAGMSLAAVSDATKIKIDHLEAVEASDASALPATPYAVGFVKVYAKFLGLDADAIAKQFKTDIGADAPPPVEEIRKTADVSPHIGEGARMVSIFGIIAILIFVVWITLQIIGNGGEADAPPTSAPEQRVRLGSAPAPAPTPRPQHVEPETLPAAAEPVGKPAANDDAAASVPPQAPAEDASAGEAETADAAASEEEADAAPTEPSPAAALNSEQIDDLAEPTAEPAAPSARAAKPAPAVVDARLTRSIAPRYPDRCARDAAALEKVTVIFDVTVEGRPANARVIQSTNSCFDETAVSTIQRWRFDPKTVDGAARPDLGKQATLNFRQ